MVREILLKIIRFSRWTLLQKRHCYRTTKHYNLQGKETRSWCSFLVINNFLLQFTFLFILSSAIIVTQLLSTTTVQYTLILNILQWIAISWLSIISDYYANTTWKTVVTMSLPTFNCYLFSTRLLHFFPSYVPFWEFSWCPSKRNTQNRLRVFFPSSSLSRLDISLRVILLPVNVFRCPPSFLWQAILNFRE